MHKLCGYFSWWTITKLKSQNVHWKLKRCQLSRNTKSSCTYIKRSGEWGRRTFRNEIPPSMLKHFRRRRLTQKWENRYEKMLCMHWNCTALFSLYIVQHKIYVAPEQMLTQTHTAMDTGTSIRSAFSFGYDVQWQMNNVKWLIVLCIIINIVINFHDLHALQRVPSSLNINSGGSSLWHVHRGHTHTHILRAWVASHKLNLFIAQITIHSS